MLWHGKNFRGIINKAKEMIFDNTGTDLISTNAEDAIKEVNSNLTPVIYDLSQYGTSNMLYSFGHAVRIGKCVILSFSGVYTSSMTPNDHFALLLPSEIRPSVLKYGEGQLNTSGGVVVTQFCVNADGTVGFNNTATSTGCNGTIVYDLP